MSVAFLASALIQFALGLVVAWILGPAEFGAYALALAAAVLAQTLVFEWIRLGATRFHHAGEGGGLVRRLGLALAWLAGGMVLLAAGLYGLAGERSALYALVPLVAVSSGFSDFRGAMLRAEFEQRGYALFMLFRNLIAIILLPLVAYRFGSAEAALLAFLMATVLASVILEFALRKRPRGEEGLKQGNDPEIAALLRYAGPIVLTNCLYLALFFAIRIVAALVGGLAMAGQVSLALDFTLKLFTTLGTALDLVLFQLAVRDSREQGEAAGRARLRVNFELVLAVILPMTAGLFLVIPALEILLVAPDYRGSFAVLVAAMLPGIALYTLVQYALHPYFQLGQQTGQLVLAAGAALVGTACGFLLLAPSGLPMPALIGLALVAALALSTGLLLRRLQRHDLPATRGLARIGAALGVMVLAVLLARMLGGGVGPAIAAICLGVATYAAAAYALDIAGLRSLLRKPQDSRRLS